MRGASLFIAVGLLAGTATARAQQVTAAAEADFGLGRHVASGADSASFQARGALGLQVGPVAAMAVVEHMWILPGDEGLDSRELRGDGLGFTVRVEAWRRRDRFAHISAGATWYDLEGSEEVTRTCDVFGTCVAGWYLETPDYSHVGLHLSGAIGARTTGDLWSGVGVRFGVTQFSIDRPGTGPDSNGALVWVAVTALVGGR